MDGALPTLLFMGCAPGLPSRGTISPPSRSVGSAKLRLSVSSAIDEPMRLRSRRTTKAGLVAARIPSEVRPLQPMRSRPPSLAKLRRSGRVEELSEHLRRTPALSQGARGIFRHPSGDRPWRHILP